MNQRSGSTLNQAEVLRFLTLELRNVLGSRFQGFWILELFKFLLGNSQCEDTIQVVLEETTTTIVLWYTSQTYVKSLSDS